MFRKLVTFEEAKRIIEYNFKLVAMGEDDCVLLEAYNRVLAENIVSELDIPPFNRSTVDGYAVCAAETLGADENEPVTLKVVGAVAAGEQSAFKLGKGEAVEIVTGAVIPEGANAVVMMEDTQREDSDLQIYSPVKTNENILKKGADIKKGAVALKKGQLLGASEIGVIAALGKTSVKVLKIPMIVILSTGNEVTELGKPLPPGKIYDINAYSLSTAVLESGGKPVYFGVAPDDKEALLKRLKTALVSADLIVTSGGVSVGPKDYTAEIVDSLGKPGVVVNGVAVKPGKPLTVGFAEGKAVFALPGHPAAALLLYYLLVRSLVQRLAGRSPTSLRTIQAFAGSKMFSAKGRRTFVMVRLEFDKDCRLIAEPVETGASGAISTLADADGFVEIAENEQFIDLDQEVTVTLLRGFNR